jgi:Spy/CpxP family protein refolding chaperone
VAVVVAAVVAHRLLRLLRRNNPGFIPTTQGRPQAVPVFLFSFAGCNIFPAACVCECSMKTSKLFALTFAAALTVGGLFICTSLAADNSATSPTPLRGQILRRIAEKLNLTADQKSQIKTILISEKDTLQNLLAQLHDARKNLRAAIQAGDANEASVRDASAKVAGVESDLAVERMKLYGNISPVLTDEQRKQISDFTQRADDFADNAIANIGNGLAQ